MWVKQGTPSHLTPPIKALRARSLSPEALLPHEVVSAREAVSWFRMQHLFGNGSLETILLLCAKLQTQKGYSVEYGPHGLHSVGRLSYTCILGNGGKIPEIPAPTHQPRVQQSFPRRVAS